jgi:2',3'-cyclic-nucleotide 2'-phosphodiesterase (5'-nucleotidase family)
MNPHSMFPRRTALALVLFITAIFSIAAQEKSQCNIKVTLLQVNDVYQFTPVDQGKSGGLGRVLTLRNERQSTSTRCEKLSVREPLPRKSKDASNVWT